MKKFSLDFLKGTVDAIKGKANTLKNLFLKLDLTKKIIAISSLSAVVVAAIVIPLFVVNSGSGSNNENGSSTSDTPKAIALSFINACIDKDAEEACSYMPDFKFKNSREQTIDGFQSYLDTFIEMYTSLNIPLGVTHRQTYYLRDEEKADLLSELKQNPQFDESKLTDYRLVGIYLNKYSGDKSSTPIDEMHEVTLIEYDGKWVVVKFTWPDLT